MGVQMNESLYKMCSERHFNQSTLKLYEKREVSMCFYGLMNGREKIRW